MKAGERSDKNNAEQGDGEARKEQAEFTVKDKRHWAVTEEERESDDTDAEASRYPTIIDEYRARAEAAEAKLHEYIEAFKGAQQEQEQFRQRLNRDVERRVELRFGELLEQLLETIDNLDLALAHVEEVPAAEPLAKGVAMARDRFIATLESHGVVKIAPDGEEFDPNLAEALQTEPVDSAEDDGKVTRTLRPGYRLGDLVIRPARVIVGKRSGR